MQGEVEGCKDHEACKFVQQTSTFRLRYEKRYSYMHIAIILSVLFTYLIHVNNVSKGASTNKSEKPDFGAKLPRFPECSSGLSSRIRGCDGSSSNLASSSLQLQQMYSDMNLQYDLDATPPTQDASGKYEGLGCDSLLEIE